MSTMTTTREANGRTSPVLPSYAQTLPPAYSSNGNTFPTTGQATQETTRSPPETSTLGARAPPQLNLPPLDLPPASSPTSSPAPARPSTELPRQNVYPSPTPSGWSTPSIRDFAHPADAPEHFTPSPTIEPSATRRPGPRSAHRNVELGLPALGDDELPPYTEGKRYRKGPAVFKSEDDYLAQLSAWAQDKLYMEPAKDNKGREVTLTGFYGAMNGEDYIAREKDRRTGGGKGKATVSGSEERDNGLTRRRTSDTTVPDTRRNEKKKGMVRTEEVDEQEEGQAGAGPSSAADETGRRKSIAQWMRRKTGGS